MKRRFIERARDRSVNRSRSPMQSVVFKLEPNELFDDQLGVEEIIGKAPEAYADTPEKPLLDCEEEMYSDDSSSFIDPKHAFSPLKMPSPPDSPRYNEL